NSLGARNNRTQTHPPPSLSATMPFSMRYHKRITIIPKFLYLNINGRHISFSAKIGDHITIHK
ncbi:unnamed protein product, partial [Rhizoctonia solani]